MKDFEICDCNIIHEAIVNQTKKKMLDNDFINEISLFFKCNKVGKEVYYSLDDEHVKEVFEVAISHIRHRKENL